MYARKRRSWNPASVNLVGGRNRYNWDRRDLAELRCHDVMLLLGRYGRRRRGAQARIARELGVSEATVSRDVAAMWASIRCDTCGGVAPRPWLAEGVQ